MPHSAAEIFRYRGAKILGIYTRPAGARSKRFPGVLLLHGYPGSEQNTDVGRELMRRGVASFALHFQGAWGSGGTYRFSTLAEQARAALKHFARKEAINARRLAVFGFSMGGWTAIHLGAREPTLKGVAAVAPVGGFEMMAPEARAFVERVSAVVRVRSPASAWRDFKNTVMRGDVAEAAARMRAPLLLLHGTADDVVPCAVSERIRRAAPNTTLVRARGASHDFLERRPWLTKRVCDWLCRKLAVK